MKITETIHAVRHTFRLLLGEGRYAERFVYSYLIVGKTICLIDAGVAATAPLILDEIKNIGRRPEEISLILLTHAHPDHIGGCESIRKHSGARVAVHPAERRWVEDVEEQYRERPIPNLFELVRKGVPVDSELTDGETISWEEGKTIKVIGTPGHSPGSISFHYEEEGTLFSGDAVPPAGSIPIYVDSVASVASIERLSRLSGISVLLSSWHDPIVGAGITEVIEGGRRYIERTGALVRKIHEKEPFLTSEELSLKALEGLGIALPRVLFMVEASIKSHLRPRPPSSIFSSIR